MYYWTKENVVFVNLVENSLLEKCIQGTS